MQAGYYLVEQRSNDTFVTFSGLGLVRQLTPTGAQDCESIGGRSSSGTFIAAPEILRESVRAP